jgi:Tol biopolymer transport system component/DNA-binding winged helix-turn-helix (wHTH) protein
MAEQPGMIRFGVFEVNLAAGELRKNGARVKLQEQPFQLLAALLRRPGEIVSKEELKEKIWADDTFVDFDHSLSTAVNKIREALGDSASSPRFIETVPRRGYRFVGGTAATSVAAETVAPIPTGAFAPRRKKVVAVAAATAALALIAVLGLSRRGSETEPVRLPEGPIPLTTLPGREASPTLSPDGTQVAFSWTGETGDNVDLYVQVVGSSSPLRLTSNPARDITPAWSPDGRQIAFERSSSSGRALYWISPLGGSETRVAEISDVGGMPPGIAWAPDGESILYGEPGAVGAPAAIHRLFLATGAKQRLTFPPAEAHSGDRHPAASPDGRTLAFSRGTLCTRDLWILPLEGGEPRKLTSQEGCFAEGHAWTPDSREIIYSQSSPSAPLGSRFWRVSIDGGEPRLMPEIAGFGQFPTISLQGRRLAYEGVEYDVNVWLYPLPGDARDAPPRRVAASTQWDADARISPDGNRIAFSSNRIGKQEVWVCNRDGSGLLKLTSLSGASGSPRWSPDGSRIAFDSAQGENWDIYVVDARGGAPRSLTTYEGLDARPSWSRDGRWIYFTSLRGGMFQIWKAPSEGGEAAQVTDGRNDTQPFESPDGRFLYFSRQHQRSELWRVPVEGGDAVATGLTFPLSGGQAWDVAEDGIYFVESRETADLTVKWFLRLLRLDAPEAVDVMEVPGHFGAGATPLDISTDGKWFVYAHHEETGSDLMFLEEFE